MYHVQSWLRETLKVFIQYLAVAFSSIPATVVYFVFMKSYPNHNAGMVVALCVGFVCAFSAWHLIERTILLPHPALVVGTKVSINTTATQRDIL